MKVHELGVCGLQFGSRLMRSLFKQYSNRREHLCWSEIVVGHTGQSRYRFPKRTLTKRSTRQDGSKLTTETALN